MAHQRRFSRTAASRVTAAAKTQPVFTYSTRTLMETAPTADILL
jgi:hypothetical protein